MFDTIASVDSGALVDLARRVLAAFTRSRRSSFGRREAAGTEAER